MIIVDKTYVTGNLTCGNFLTPEDGSGELTVSG
jgi:hypothetical protein